MHRKMPWMKTGEENAFLCELKKKKAVKHFKKTEPRVRLYVLSVVLGQALRFVPLCCLRAQRVGNRRPYCRSQPPARLISGEEDFSRKKCLAWFYEYAGPDEVVGPEGMEKFCEDIGVEPENIIMLVLAWKLEAESMGFFTKEEWLKGMTSLQCDCTEKLQSRFDFLRSQLNDISSFKNIYRYAFDFARDKDQRSLDIDTAKSMLALLLGRTWPLFSVFYQYLEQSKYRVMNKDQWYNVLEFSRTVHADLSNYDEDGAWPVLLDEFVEWQKIRQTS